MPHFVFHGIRTFHPISCKTRVSFLETSASLGKGKIEIYKFQSILKIF